MLRSNRRSVILGGLAAVIIAVSGLAASQTFARDDIETPRYEVVTTHEGFEVRRYAPRIVAEVQVTGSERAATNAGFRLLADYIFGNNTARGSIAMTAPVDRRAGSETIAMTAPVDRRQTDDDEHWVIAFTMPSQYTLETLPAPNDERVKLRLVPPTHYAAVRFSGAPSEARVQQRMAALVHAVEAAGLQSAGLPPTYARYDPPWRLPMLRRNEILLELEMSSEP